MKRLYRFILWLAVVVIIIISSLNLFLTWEQKYQQSDSKKNIELVSGQVEEVNNNYSELSKKVENLENIVKSLVSSKPEDGRDGKDGKDNISTHTVEQKVIEHNTIKEVPVKGEDGLTPLLRCNQQKNRWEFRYPLDENWRLLNNEIVKCTVE